MIRTMVNIRHAHICVHTDYYIHWCMHAYASICTLTYVYARKNMKLLYMLHIYLSALARAHSLIHAHTNTEYVYIYIYIHICIHMCSVCVYVYIYVHVYVCMYTCMHVHVTWIYTSYEQIHGVYIARNIYKCTTILRRCMRVSGKLKTFFSCLGC